MAQVHAICDELEEKIRGEFGAFDILIHPEPAGNHEPETKAAQYEYAKRQEKLDVSN